MSWNLCNLTSGRVVLVNASNASNSASTLIDFAAGKVSVYTFPNPATEIANFRFQLNESARVKIALHSSNGQLVSEVMNQQFAPGKYVHSHDVSSLTPGIYVFTYQLDNNLPASRRMVVK